MTGRRPGGKITPLHEPWVTVGIQWHCQLPNGEPCDESDMENPERTRQIWEEARRHRDENPSEEHHIVLDRMQRVKI